MDRFVRASGLIWTLRSSLLLPTFVVRVARCGVWHSAPSRLQGLGIGPSVCHGGIKSQEVLDLIAGPTLTLLPNLTGLSIVDVNDTMGDYVDDMD